jgi:glycosyltransferase involved in cell wall biosynthesis
MTRITLGIAHCNDWAGAVYSIQSAQLQWSALPAHIARRWELEIVVVDNDPSTKHATALQAFLRGVPRATWIAMDSPRGTAAPRQRVWDEATGDYVLMIDSHVLLHPHAILRLLTWWEAHPDSADMLQGPWLYDAISRHPDGGPSCETHMEPVWRSEMYGTWARDPRVCGEEPFAIPMHGLGLFAMRRDKWPGFSSHFRGFGGEEGYIHEKVRRAGGRVLCCPWLQWWHNFHRPDGIPYRCDKRDKLRNYLIVADELGMSREPAIQHFGQELGAGNVPPHILAEVAAEVDALGLCDRRPATTYTPPVMVPGLVSCLMVTYGRANLVERSIGYWMSQTYRQRELIVINHAPVPITLAEPIEGVTIVNAPNTDLLGANWQRALDRARGEWVMQWDDDDLYTPHHIAQRVAHIGDKPAAKSRQSWYWPVAEDRTALAEGVHECSWLFRADVVRHVGVSARKGADCLLPVIEAMQADAVHFDAGDRSTFITLWSNGVWHLSGAGGDRTAESIAREHRARNIDFGDRPRVPSVVASKRILDQWRALAGAPLWPVIEARRVVLPDARNWCEISADGETIALTVNGCSAPVDTECWSCVCGPVDQITVSSDAHTADACDLVRRLLGHLTPDCTIVVPADCDTARALPWVLGDGWCQYQSDSLSVWSRSPLSGTTSTTTSCVTTYCSTSTTTTASSRVRDASQPLNVAWALADLSQGGVARYTASLLRALDGVTVIRPAAVLLANAYKMDHASARQIALRCPIYLLADAPHQEDGNVPDCVQVVSREDYREIMGEADVVTTSLHHEAGIRAVVPDWCGKPLLYQAHGECEWTTAAYQHVQPHTTRVMAVGQSCRDALRPVLCHPCDIIEACIWPDALTPWPDQHKARLELLHQAGASADLATAGTWLCYWGRMAADKRLDRICDVVREYRQKIGPAVGVFIGDGWQRDAMHQLVRERLPHDHVLVPWQSDLGPVLAAADVLVVASDKEGAPLTMLEALAGGVAVVAAPVGVAASVALETRRCRLVSPWSSLDAAREAANVLSMSSVERDAARWQDAQYVLRRFSPQRLARQFAASVRATYEGHHEL